MRRRSAKRSSCSRALATCQLREARVDFAGVGRIRTPPQVVLQIGGGGAEAVEPRIHEAPIAQLLGRLRHDEQHPLHHRERLTPARRAAGRSTSGCAARARRSRAGSPARRYGSRSARPALRLRHSPLEPAAQLRARTAARRRRTGRARARRSSGAAFTMKCPGNATPCAAVPRGARPRGTRSRA